MKPPFESSLTAARARRAFTLLLAVAAAIAGEHAYSATTLTWDANTSTTGPQDGNGTWSTSLANWWDGAQDNVWDNGAGNSAIFGVGSTGGGVTVGSNITVANVTFNTAPYTIAGGGGFTLTLASTAFSGSGSGNYTASIGASLAGTNGFSLTNSGAATSTFILALSGNNTGLTGDVTIGATTATTGAAELRVDSGTALGHIGNITIGTASMPVADTSSLVLNTTAAVGTGQTVTIFGVGLNNGGALQGSTGAINIWNGNVVIGATGARIGGGTSGTLMVNGVISEATAGSAVVFSRLAGATTVLNAINSYTGDTQIYGGLLGSTSTLVIGMDNAINSVSDFSVLTTAAVGAEALDLHGHVLTLRALDTNSSQASAAQFLSITNNAATPSILTIGDTTSTNTKIFSGSIQDGTGGMSLVKINANTQVFIGNNTYTGSTTVNAGTLQVGASTIVGFNGSLGALASVNFILNGGSFVVNNTGAGNNSGTRLSDTAAFNFNGGSFVYKGSDQPSTNSSETIGNINLGTGISSSATGISAITLQFGSTNTATVTANQLTRTTGGDVALVNGANLGEDSTSTANVSRLLLNQAPNLVGATPALDSGINAGSTSTQIVPFLLGEVSSTTGLSTATGIANTFVTYDAVTGLRPLSFSEFAPSISPGDAGNNVRLTTAVTLNGSAAVNSLILGISASGALTITGTVTDTSGALLFTTASSIVGGTLAFGGAEGIITVNPGATGIISTKITGSNGVSLFGAGTLGVGGQNTFTGDFTVRGGVAVPQSSSTSTGGVLQSSPFGLGNLVFDGGQMRASTTGGASVSIGNNVIFESDTTFVSSPNTITFTGGVTIANGSRTITNSSAGPIVFSGAISGGAGFGLNFAGTGTTTLSGNSTYSGATTIQSGAVIYSGSNTHTAVTVGNSASLATSATLRGSGTVGSVTAIGSGSASTSGATVDPGNSTGVAGILKTGGISITNGAHLSFQIGGDVAGGESTTGYDQVISSRAVNLAGGDLQLTLLGTPTFSASDILYLIINNGGAPLSGTFASVSLNGSPVDPSDIVLDGRQFQLVYGASFTGSGTDNVANDVALQAVVVPEPGAGLMMLGSLATAGLCIRPRRRNRA